MLVTAPKKTGSYSSSTPNIIAIYYSSRVSVGDVRIVCALLIYIRERHGYLEPIVLCL